MSDPNPQQHEALRHHHIYGHRGTPPTNRITASNWKTEPMQKPITSPWDQSIPHTEIPKLLNGFRPEQMEHKWFVYADGPDENGNVAVHMHRSWTGHKMVEARFTVEVDAATGVVAEKDARFVELVWESDPERYKGQTEEGAKEMAKAVCRWVLGAELP